MIFLQLRKIYFVNNVKIILNPFVYLPVLILIISSFNVECFSGCERFTDYRSHVEQKMQGAGIYAVVDTNHGCMHE